METEDRSALMARFKPKVQPHNVVVDDAVALETMLYSSQALGAFEEQDGVRSYHLGDQVYDCLKDLMICLRRDDPFTRCNLRQLGLWHVLQQDLLPILVYHGDNDRVAYRTLKLIATLTLPSRLQFDDRMVREREGAKVNNESEKLQLLAALRSYKEAFCSSEVMAAFVQQLMPPLEVPVDERSEDQRQRLELLLAIVRNILHVSDEAGSDCHERLLLAFDESKILDLLIVLANQVAQEESSKGSSLQLLEIVYLVLAGQEPAALLKARADFAKNGDGANSSAAMLAGQEWLREKAHKRDLMAQVSSRHSRFHGALTVQLIDGKKRFFRRPMTRLHEASDMDLEKQRLRKKAPTGGFNQMNRQFSVRAQSILCSFALEFTEHCYNDIMQTVFSELKDDSEKSNDIDLPNYLWSMRFFMELSRLSQSSSADFAVDMIAVSLSRGSSHFLLSRINRFHDNRVGDKDRTDYWRRRVQLGLRAFHELLTHVQCMSRPSSSRLLRNNAVQMRLNMFYDYANLEVFSALTKDINVKKHAVGYMSDLVQVVHLLMLVLESHAQDAALVVRKKRRVIRVEETTVVPEESKPASSNTNMEVTAVPTTTEGAPNAGPSTDVTPTEAKVASVVTSRMKSTGLVNAHETETPATAPLDDSLSALVPDTLPTPTATAKGQDGTTSPTHEFAHETTTKTTTATPTTTTATTTTMTDAPTDAPVVALASADAAPKPTVEKIRNVEYVSTDVAFNFDKYLQQFCKVPVVRAYLALLAHYRENSDLTNRCVLKMLHRVAVNREFRPMMYQLSALITFNKILSERDTNPSPTLLELRKFAKYIVRGLTKHLQQRPSLFVELLFWKPCGTAYDIEHGGMGLALPGQVAKWSQEEDDYLRELFGTHQVVLEASRARRARREQARAQGEILDEDEEEDDDDDRDIADLLSDELETRSRRQVINRLVKLELVQRGELRKRYVPRPRRVQAQQTGGTADASGGGDLTSGKKGKKAKKVAVPENPEWSRADDLLLRELHEEYRDLVSCIPMISLEMYSKKEAQIAQRLREMSLQVMGPDGEMVLPQVASGGTKEAGAAAAAESNADDEGDIDNDNDDDDDDDEEDGGGVIARQRRVESAAALVEVRDAVLWIKQDLEDAAEEREDSTETDETTARLLLTFTANHDVWLAMPTVLALVRACGYERSEDVDLVRWRLPASLSTDALRATVILIDRGLQRQVERKPAPARKTKKAAKAKVTAPVVRVKETTKEDVEEKKAEEEEEEEEEEEGRELEQDEVEGEDAEARKKRLQEELERQEIEAELAMLADMDVLGEGPDELSDADDTEPTTAIGGADETPKSSRSKKTSRGGDDAVDTERLKARKRRDGLAKLLKNKRDQKKRAIKSFIETSVKSSGRKKELRRARLEDAVGDGEDGNEEGVGGASAKKRRKTVEENGAINDGVGNDDDGERKGEEEEEEEEEGDEEEDDEEQVVRKKSKRRMVVDDDDEDEDETVRAPAKKKTKKTTATNAAGSDERSKKKKSGDDQRKKKRQAPANERWTKAEDLLLLELYDEQMKEALPSATSIAQDLYKKSPDEVAQRLREFGLEVCHVSHGTDTVAKAAENQEMTKEAETEAREMSKEAETEATTNEAETATETLENAMAEETPVSSMETETM